MSGRRRTGQAVDLYFQEGKLSGNSTRTAQAIKGKKMWCGERCAVSLQVSLAGTLTKMVLATPKHEGRWWMGA